MGINVEDRVNRGVDNFMSGCSCAQSVVLAFSDIYDIPEETAMRMASSFGGGLGRLRLTCGAVSGMCMLAGFDKGMVVRGDNAAKAENYRIVQMLTEEFKRENHSITCAELLKMRACKVETTPIPDQRNAKYYAARPCAKMVASACRIFAEYLKSQQETKQ